MCDWLGVSRYLVSWSLNRREWADILDVRYQSAARGLWGVGFAFDLHAFYLLALGLIDGPIRQRMIGLG
jgi:hypothetical protein